MSGFPHRRLLPLATVARRRAMMATRMGLVAAALALACSTPARLVQRPLPLYWVVVRNTGTLETRVWVSLDGVTHNRLLGKVIPGESRCFRLEPVDQWLLAEMTMEGPSLDSQTPRPTPRNPATPGNFVTTVTGTHDRRSNEFYPGTVEATYQLTVWDQAARLIADIPDEDCTKLGGAQ
jgi:hypothetical protein